MTAGGDLLDCLLQIAFRQPIVEADFAAGLARFRDLAGPVEDESFRAALVAALAQGLVHDPVWLPPGSLQCSWRLEVTPAGAARARSGSRENH